MEHTSPDDIIQTLMMLAVAIIAGLFLQRFVDKATPWLHFDMMGWNISNKPGKPEGGEAMGIRAIAHYLLQVYG